MDNEQNKIDDLFRDTLKGYEPEPSRKVWRGVGIMLALGEFVRFSFTNFSQNIFQMLLAGSAATAVVVYTAVSVLSPETVPVKPAQKPSATIVSAPIDSVKTKPAVAGTDVTDPAAIRQPLPRIYSPKSGIIPQIQMVRSEETILPQPENHVNELRLTEFWETMQTVKTKALSAEAFQISQRVDLTGYSQKLRNQLSKYQDTNKRTTSFALTAGYALDQMSIPHQANTGTFLYNTADIAGRVEKGRFYLQTGISASLQFDNGLYNVTAKSYDSVGFYYNVHYYVPDPSNPESVILVTSKVTLYDSVAHLNTLETSNKYVCLQIPLILGYKLADFKRISFYAFGGPVFQFEASREEPQLDFTVPSLYPATIVNLSPKRASTNWQLTGGFRASFRLNRRLSIDFEPSYKWYISNIYTGTNYGNPFSVGFRTGISVSF